MKGYLSIILRFCLRCLPEGTRREGHDLLLGFSAAMLGAIVVEATKGVSVVDILLWGGITMMAFMVLRVLSR